MNFNFIIFLLQIAAGGMVPKNQRLALEDFTITEEQKFMSRMANFLRQRFPEIKNPAVRERINYLRSFKYFQSMRK